ncbi:MAG: hypothetical protein AB7V14_12425 [Kiritimatiellia bacterium]
MNTNKAKKWAQSLLALPLLAAMLVLVGCESDDTETDVTPTRFTLDSELWNYSDTDDYTWDTTLDRAVAIVRIDDFTEGDVGMRIYDGAGKLVLVAALNTLNNAFYNGEDLFFQRQTDQGVAGRWRIVLDFNDFSGKFDLTLE